MKKAAPTGAALLFAFKTYNALDMLRVRKHIKGLDVGDAISVFGQNAQIARLCFRLAGNVNHLFWC